MGILHNQSGLSHSYGPENDQHGRLSIPLSNDLSSVFSPRSIQNKPLQRQQVNPIARSQPASSTALQQRQMSLPGPARTWHLGMAGEQASSTWTKPTSPFNIGVVYCVLGLLTKADSLIDQFAYQSPKEPTQPLPNSSSPLLGSTSSRRSSVRRVAERPMRNPYLQRGEEPYRNEFDDSVSAPERDLAAEIRQAYTPISKTLNPKKVHAVPVTEALHVTDKPQPFPIKQPLAAVQRPQLLHEQPLSFAAPLSQRPPTAQGIQLVSPQDLPDRFRQVFPYPLFNAVQSKCFKLIYNTNDNVVISAPTGSGKTAILELAICKLIEGYDPGQFKIVYQAPTKSLCAERVQDWQRKFSHLNLPCAELTGDTDYGEVRTIGRAAIIVTTPEKWDSITRKWKDHVKLLQMVKLFLIDEVHILKDSRGATLEAVVSRMKSIGVQVRFVALSATVPNSQDVATWLGKDSTNGHIPACRETFGEDFRPVKLEKHVYGYDRSGNDFAYDQFLDSKLPDVIAKHTKCKPMMIFCFTRKSCESTAAKLAEWWTQCRPSDRAWPQPEARTAVGNADLQDLVLRGVAFHHAGLNLEDRSAIESAFLKGGISVICCTSTLAVGINLPCHLVVIKNTVGYQDDGLKEYSDLELIQMLGRAGRPQFDKEAIAIIVTRAKNVDRYKKMISGQEILESTLHSNLIEHLNSEIGLGTVNDVYTAKQWLSGTFLSVRMRHNPTYYKFGCDSGSKDADERLEKVGVWNIKLLQDTKLITSDQRFSCTDYGLAMSKFMVSFETMKLLLTIPKHARVGQMVS
jgi:replicative superfamily II helicase